MKRDQGLQEFTYEFRAMGTTVRLWLWHNHEQRARGALAAAARTFGEVEAAVSRFRPDSELSRLNRTAGRPFQASPLLYNLVADALAWRDKTGGIFDPAVLNSLIAHGYDRTFAEIAATPAGGSPVHTQPLDSSGVRLAAGRQIFLPQGVGIDLGGIAKGWTAQQVAHRLGMWGPCLVDAGGDIACTAAPPTGDWVVTVADPQIEELDSAVLALRHAAAATSSRTRRRWEHDGLAAHHLIDPRTGVPADTDLLCVTVVTGRLPHAEIYAKCALILGSAAGMAWLKHQGDISGLLITEDGQQLTCGPLLENAYGTAYLSTQSFAERFRPQAEFARHTR